MDGSTSAAILALANADNECHFFAASYSRGEGSDVVDSEGTPFHLKPEIMYKNNPDDATDKNAYDALCIVDFSMPVHQLAALTQRFGTNFTVLDHHDTIQYDDYAKACDELSSQLGTEVRPAPTVVFKAGGSGALLAYMHNVARFDKKPPLPYVGNLICIAQLVSDRDTWQRSNVRAFQFYDGVSGMVFEKNDDAGIITAVPGPTVAKMMSIITSGNINQLIEWGISVAAVRDEKIEEAISKYGHVTSGTIELPIAHMVLPIERSICREAAQQVNERQGLKLVIMPRISSKTPDMVNISISSYGLDKNSPYCARNIAQTYGGNGHVSAAGCSIPLVDFQRLYPTVCMPELETMRNVEQAIA